MLNIVNFVFIRSKATLKNQLVKTSVSNPLSIDSFWYFFNCLLYMYYLYNYTQHKFYRQPPHLFSWYKFVARDGKTKGKQTLYRSFVTLKLFLVLISKPFYADIDHPFWITLLKHNHTDCDSGKRCYFIFTSNGKRPKSDNTYQSHID